MSVSLLERFRVVEVTLRSFRLSSVHPAMTSADGFSK